MNVVLYTALSIGGIAFVAGVVLFIAAKKFAVKEDPMIDVVEELLPGANCGGCGFAGCRAFAEALVNTRDEELRCPVASADAPGWAWKWAVMIGGWHGFSARAVTRPGILAATAV